MMLHRIEIIPQLVQLYSPMTPRKFITIIMVNTIYFLHTSCISVPLNFDSKYCNKFVHLNYIKVI